MAKLKKGDLVVEASLPKEVVTLKSQGFVVVEAPKPAPKPEIKK